MKRLALLLLPLCAVGCTSTKLSNETSKLEVGLQKVKSEVEDIKHDLNAYQIEHHIIEGKISDHHVSIEKLKAEAYEDQQNQLEKIQQELAQFEKRLTQLTRHQENLLGDIRKLSTHANDTTTALSQYKEKISRFEKSISTQNRRLEELAILNGKLLELSKENLGYYIVQPGDTLEKIARHLKVPLEKLKKINHLNEDLIKPGQKLKLPDQQ